MLSEKKILNETKNHNPPLQVKWSVPNNKTNEAYNYLLVAIDFANRTTIAVSEAVTVDMTSPDKSNNPILIPNRHLTSKTEINPW